VSIEIIGVVGTQEVSESRGTVDGPPVSADYLARFGQAYEAAGFRGFDPLDDVIDWGKELVPLLREQAGTLVGPGEAALSG
jgi:hypothetical protein